MNEHLALLARWRNTSGARRRGLNYKRGERLNALTVDKIDLWTLYGLLSQLLPNPPVL